jgi:hypothetical protein
VAALQGGTAEEKEASKGDLDRAEGVLRMAQERVQAADQKREQGLKENARRRHDFVPFILKVRRRSLYVSLCTRVLYPFDPFGTTEGGTCACRHRMTQTDAEESANKP